MREIEEVYTLKDGEKNAYHSDEEVETGRKKRKRKSRKSRKKRTVPRKKERMIDSYEVLASAASIATTDIASDRTGKKKGRTVTVTTEDMQKRKNDDRGRRDNYRQVSKVEEQAPKALMAIDGVRWDWSYMVNDKENHALVTDKEAPTEFALMANPVLKVRYLITLSSKDLDNLLESQRLEKNKEGLGYSVVPPPPAQIYSSPKKDLSWTGLSEFKDDIVTDYSRPAPTVESSSHDAQNKNPSVTKTEASPSTISPKSFIKFVKENDSAINSKTDKAKTAKKHLVKYAEQYRKPTKKPNGSSQNNFNDKGYWDSGCSRHMTCNISYLSDYEPFDGGYVSFGQGGYKITGKGTIKTSTEDATSQEPQDDCSTDVPESSGNCNPTATLTNPLADQMETLTVETPIPTTLVDFPKGVRPIGTKWVLKNKKDERGIVFRNKARLVAQEYTHEEGIDYDEDPEFPAREYKVEKAMYRLHQAPRAWYGTLSKYLLTNGFQRVLQKEDVIFLSQEKYVGDILKKFGYSDVRSSNTPMDKENPWDIMFAICAYARHQVTPKECHLHAIKRIFRYLKGHPKLGLWYPKESPFDYGGATQDRKSTTGGCQFLGRRLISWQCKKQTIVTTSTTEAEYVTAASCCGQVLLSMPCEALSKEISSSIFVYSEQMTHEFMHVYLASASVYVWIGNTIMARLQFCDYHNMIAILEKSEHNVDFHPIVDFIEPSPLRYALIVKPTIYVSYIRQFWSTARIETKEEGTKILATVDSILRTVIESSLRRNIKLQDEEGIISLPDTKLFKNLTLMGYNISLNQKFTFQKGRIFSLFDTMLVPQGEVSSTPTEPYHTPSPKAYPTSYTTHSSPTHPPVTTASIPIVTLYETTPLRQYTKRARIAQSSALLPIADEPASPLRDFSEGETCPTESGLKADQDRPNIAKTSTLPYDSVPRVTSPDADKESMQLKLDELTGLCTSLQRQHSEMVAKFKAQELEINRLKARVKLFKDREGVAAEIAGDDAPIKGRNLDEGEAAAERVSDDTEEMATVLTSMETATVLASRAAKVPISSRSIPTAGSPAVEVPTGSDVVPTASLVFTTITVVTPYRRRKGKEIMVESETPKKRRGMTFEEIEAKFTTVWKQIEDFVPMGSKEEANRFKRKGIRFEQESVKKLKTSEEVPEEVKTPDEVLKENVKEMIGSEELLEDHKVERQLSQLPIFCGLIEALGQGGPEPVMGLSERTHTQNLMHALVEWKLYDLCGVHQLTSNDKEIFMLVEKEYPLKKGLEIVMICYKLQVENYSQMANDLILKIYKIANCPSQQEFPLPKEVPTTSEESSHCQKKREATAMKIALLLKSRRNCQSKSDDNYTKLVPHVTPCIVGITDALYMTRAITRQEIKEALFSMGNDKAPGPDELNHTIISIIPKVRYPARVNDYRPILCSNVLFKFKSKIIANWIKESLKVLVSPNQSAFVLGRSISDNNLLTQELMHNYHLDHGTPRCAFKVDIQKAYDTVDWDFLKVILNGFGFHDRMVKWFMECVSTASYSIFINGDLHGYFKGKRRLRQGDPLSLYLFTLVMEVLTLMLHWRVRNAEFTYHRYCSRINIINLCFADDLFLFAHDDA
uniref:Reverse transcriptase domain-containing protein n=1 Tax=Tanacetum cinerariifolium TaxID=118510 RepID=A0A699GN18_TANCI|nr:hypothetical protein [Tanacetum cinerariifolium]